MGKKRKEKRSNLFFLCQNPHVEGGATTISDYEVKKREQIEQNMPFVESINMTQELILFAEVRITNGEGWLRVIVRVKDDGEGKGVKDNGEGYVRVKGKGEGWREGGV